MVWQPSPPSLKGTPPVSSAQPNTIYSGPKVPTAYDSNWQYFTNLTSDQIGWFRAQPEWQNFLSYVALSPATATIGTPTAVVNSSLQTAGQTVAVAKPVIAL